MTIIEEVRQCIQKWWDENVDHNFVDRIYVFGSLVTKKGERFGSGDKSDVDLIAVLPDKLNTPIGRVEACESLQASKLNLELELLRILKRERADQAITSIVPVTATELQLSIHKGDDPDFFCHKQFFRLGSWEEAFELSSKAFLETLKLPSGLITAVATCQKTRHAFVNVSPNGNYSLKEWNEDDPIPKEVMRAMQKVESEIKDSPEDRGKFDINYGLLEVIKLIDNHAWLSGDSYSELLEWLLVRIGGRGEKTGLMPKQHLLIWEIVAQRASLWLQEQYLKQPKDTKSFQDLAASQTVLTEDFKAKAILFEDLQRRQITFELFNEWHGERVRESRRFVTNMIFECEQQGIPLPNLTAIERANDEREDHVFRITNFFERWAFLRRTGLVDHKMLSQLIASYAAWWQEAFFKKLKVGERNQDFLNKLDLIEDWVFDQNIRNWQDMGRKLI